jgi:hypothetical protein
MFQQPLAPLAPKKPPLTSRANLEIPESPTKHKKESDATYLRLPLAPKKPPLTSRAHLEAPESPTKHTKEYCKYSSLKHFFMAMEIIVQK